MSSGNETGQQVAGGDDSGTSDTIIAAVALIISVVALVIAVLQALQQYYSSAQGFSSCSEAVIGGWAVYTRRKYRKSEFRFEVRYTAPILFVCPPWNKNGPLGRDSPTSRIIKIDGFTPKEIHAPTTEDLKRREEERNARAAEGDNLTLSGLLRYIFAELWADSRGRTIEETERRVQDKTPELVHTAENDRAAWLDLLIAIQRMERESIRWHVETRREEPALIPAETEQPRRSLRRRFKRLVGYTQPENPAPSSESVAERDIFNRSLIVCLQKQRRSWDNMPEGLSKPYATTTLSHIIEIAAMLGIFWRQFDLDKDLYRAQGNGFSLDGYYIDGFGITFNFRKSGQTWFQENRVVPNDLIKELCFGYAPTVFRRSDEVQYTDEPRGLGTLQLGSMTETGRTLAIFGCNNTAVNYFLKGEHETRHGAMFPVAFEILGMVGTIIQIKGTKFRMLPNPTVFHWNVTESFLRVVLEEFGEAMTSINGHRDHISTLCEEVKRVLAVLPDLNGSKDPGTLKGGAVAFGLAALNALHDTIELCDNYLHFFEREVEDEWIWISSTRTDNLPRLVLRSHIQAVLELVNKDAQRVTPEDDDDDARARSALLWVLKQMDDAEATSRPYMLVDLYLSIIRPAVMDSVCKLLSVSQSPKFDRRQMSWGQRSEGSKSGGSVKLKKLRTNPIHGTKPMSPKGKDQPTWRGKDITEDDVGDVWCTLVVRMLCWLLLHDFHAKDAQISKSDCFGSRTPVYLA